MLLTRIGYEWRNLHGNVLGYALMCAPSSISDKKAMERLPIYKARITSMETGMFTVSLVDCPAVEKDFMAFDRQVKPMEFKVDDEEKRIVTGVLMRADHPIYRRDADGYEYYVVFDKETIEVMVEKWLADGVHNCVNLDHNHNRYVDYVFLKEVYVKDSSRGISPVGFEDIEEGSLFGTYKILNDEVWESVKSGEFKGFSIETVTEMERVTETIKEDYMTKLKKIAMKIMNEIINMEMRSTATDKGVLVWEGDEELKVGDEVQIEAEDGTRTQAPADEYTYTTDIKTFKVTVDADGKVTEIEDITAEEAEKEPEEKPEDEKPEENKLEEIVEPTIENPTNEGEETDTEAIVKLREEVNELYALVDELKKEIEELKKKPAAMSAEEQFENIKKEEKKLKGAAKYAAALKRS